MAPQGPPPVDVPVPDLLPGTDESIDVTREVDVTRPDLLPDIDESSDLPRDVDVSEPDLWEGVEPVPELGAEELAAWELLISGPAPVDLLEGIAAPPPDAPEASTEAEPSTPPEPEPEPEVPARAAEGTPEPDLAPEPDPTSSEAGSPPPNGGDGAIAEQDWFKDLVRPERPQSGALEPAPATPGAEPSRDLWADEDLPITPSSEIGSGDDWLRLLWSEDLPLPDEAELPSGSEGSQPPGNDDAKPGQDPSEKRSD